MWASILAISISCIVVVIVAIIVLRAKDWAVGQTSPSDGHDPVDRMRRLLNPNWEDFEARFGVLPPHALRRLYDDRALLTAYDTLEAPDPRNQEVTWEISDFRCVEARDFDNQWDCLDVDLLAFASDSFGNPFLVRITGDVNDPLPVWFWMHDGGTDELEAGCTSLDEFRRWMCSSR